MRPIQLPGAYEGIGGGLSDDCDISGLGPSREIRCSRGARVLLAVGVIAYIAFYLTWSICNYREFGTYGFDLGIHDQAVWLLSRGESPFVTISGNHYFGDHLSWIMLVMVPFYWLFHSASVLLVAQSLALGLAAIPAFLVARKLLRSEWLAGAVAWAYLLNPYLGWTNLEQFHPDSFEVPLVFLAFLFVIGRRWRAFFVTIVLLMLVKEDVPLLVLGLGIWVAFRYDRGVGLRTTVLGALWLFVNFRFLLPLMSGTGSLAAYVSSHATRIPFGGLGGFLHTLVTRPWRVLTAAFGPGRPLYYLQVFAPLGFLPWLSPSTLAAVILPLAANGLSTFYYQQSLQHHYGTLVVPGLLVAAIFGIANARSRRLRWGVVGVMLVGTMVSLWLWGPMPGSRDPGPWIDRPTEYTQAAYEAMALIPDDAVISTDFRFVTHLDHRVEVYEFPCPWRAVNWADESSQNESLPDRVARVQYVLVSGEMDDKSTEAVEEVIASGEFEVTYDQGGVILYKRHPPETGPPAETTD
jgi:uncharacterized membrane protein